MNWKIWKKHSAEEMNKGETPVKLPKPREIPQTVGRYLVVELGKDPDWVWNLKAAVKPRSGEKEVFEVRVFDASETAVRRVSIRDYTSFDAHPELILFEGWYDKKKNTVEVHEKTTETSRAA